LLGGGFAVPSETAFKLLPFCLELCKCNKFPFVGLLGVWWLCQFQAKQLLNLCRFAWSFASAIDFLCAFVWFGV
jgi:hypothetical protein